jgi:O-antigen/teichoic acid export membrane protein
VNSARVLLDRLIIMSLIFTLVGVMLAYFLNKWIFHLFVGIEYQKISYLLPWVVLAGGLFASGQIVSLNLMNELNTNKLIYPKLITALLGALINIIGAFYFGVIGVIGGLVFFSLLYFIWIITVVKKINFQKMSKH